MKSLMVAGIVVALFGFFTGKWIITVLYGTKFEGSGELFRILLFSPFFAFLSFFLTNVNTALNRQSRNTAYAFVVCTVNIGLNLYLIPAMLGSGAAIARVVTEIAGCLLLVLAIGRSMAVETVAIFVKSLTVAAILFLFLYAIRSLNPILFLCVGSCASLIVVLSVRMFDKGEIEKLKAALPGGAS
jgi:O-antigen/teichoic acid export membrane protein